MGRANLGSMESSLRRRRIEYDGFDQILRNKFNIIHHNTRTRDAASHTRNGAELRINIESRVVEA